MKKLILVTSNYPYGTGEPYVYQELIQASLYADVFILPMATDKYSMRRVVPPNIKVLHVDDSYHKKTSLLFKSVFSSKFILGIIELWRRHGIKICCVKELIKFIYSAYAHFFRVKKTLIESAVEIDENTVFYSYWMDSTALAITGFKKYKCTTVTRAHGGDLYDERTPWGHQFLRSYLAKKLDYICPISNVGKRYLESRIGQFDNIIPIHLGTDDYGIEKYEFESTFKIVSCSSAIPLKRIDKIIEAIAFMPLGKRSVEWIHFGDGPEMDYLKRLAKEKLDNMSFCFMGQVSNFELLQYYKNSCVSVFINVSETEGVPVSIMEAMSFGIPIIASDVGGTNELVRDKDNGLLLNSSPTALEIKNAIDKIYNMSQEEYLLYRKNARKCYLENWNSVQNYRRFYELILSK